MFTGLVEGLARVTAVGPDGDGKSLEVDLVRYVDGVGVGDSVALSGVCCTVTAVAGSRARFWLSPETLRRTWFGTIGAEIAAGRNLNVERCLRVGQSMGGHIVQGHVDGVGRVVGAVGRQGGTWEVEIPADLQRYCVEKGSIALDGVSLTIASQRGERLCIAVIPHTAGLTTIGELAAGAPVNVEVDVLAKYVERLLDARLSSPRT